MYIHPAFRMDAAASLAFAAARGFGLVVANDGGKPVASPLPFLVVHREGAPTRIEFHVARNNPLATLAAAGGVWLLAVQGFDTYVSPDWYVTPDQVPTWLYESAHFSGPVRVMSSAERAEHVERLSDEFEARLAPKPVWKLAKVAQNRREMLLQGIVAIEMTVHSVEGSAKLNQHKTDADQVAVAEALAARHEPAARATAARMTALRPSLASAQ
jgi:transcriptional regulator